MAKIKKYVVSHCSCGSPSTPIFFNSEEECKNYILTNLIPICDAAVKTCYSEDSNVRTEYMKLNTIQEKLNWSYNGAGLYHYETERDDKVRVCGYGIKMENICHEFTYEPIEVEISYKEFIDNMREMSQE